MNTPEWTKPGIYGAVIGAVLTGIVGFSWGGWMTTGTANKMAKTMANEKVVAALVPVCVKMSMADSSRVAKLAVIRAKPSYQQRDALMDAGWATVPGSDAPDRNLAQACLETINAETS